MLSYALLPVLLVIAAVGAVLALGRGDARRGRLRAIRRIRTVRRRFLRPLLGRLSRAMSLAWTRPIRADVSSQIRRVADQVERTHAAAGAFVAAEQGLSRSLSKLVELSEHRDDRAGYHGPRDGDRQEQGGARRRSGGHGWLTALALALAGAAVAGGNGWLLYRYLLPAVPDLVLIPAEVDAFTIALAFTVLPFLLGAVYLALRGAGAALGLRVLGVVVILLVIGLTAAEAALVVVALEALGIAEPTWWGGVAVSTLLAGSAALLPATSAALAHSAVERLERWASDRERRLAGRSMARQDQLAGRLGITIDDLRSSVETIRAEVRALASEHAGRLLLQPDSAPTVERAGTVLRRLARGVDRGSDTGVVEGQETGRVLGRVIGSLFALLIWLVAAAGALTLATDGLRHGAEVGFTLPMTAGAFAATAALLLGGLFARKVMFAPGIRLGSGGRALLVLLLVVGTAALAATLAPLMAATEGSYFQGQPLIAGAWLGLLVLVAAAASIQLAEGVGSAAGVVTWMLAGAASVILILLDLGLAGLDRCLGGARRPTERARLRTQHAPRAVALGGGPRAR